MSVLLTEKAARQIEKQLAKRGQGIGLKLGVKKAGCSGFAYVIEYADQLADGDEVYEAHGVKVVVSGNDAPYLQGIELDFRREGLNEAFVFNNPNAKNTCGCGESFSV